MTPETYLRTISFIVATVVTASLVHDLVTGRWGFGRSAVRRVAEPRAYWAAMGMNAIMALTLALAAALAPDRDLTLFLFIGVLGGQALNMLISRKLYWWRGRVLTPTNAARAYWGWLTVYLVMIALFVLLLFWPGRS